MCARDLRHGGRANDRRGVSHRRRRGSAMVRRVARPSIARIAAQRPRRSAHWAGEHERGVQNADSFGRLRDNRCERVHEPRLGSDRRRHQGVRCPGQHDRGAVLGLEATRRDGAGAESLGADEQHVQRPGRGLERVAKRHGDLLLGVEHAELSNGGAEAAHPNLGGHRPISLRAQELPAGQAGLPRVHEARRRGRQCDRLNVCGPGLPHYAWRCRTCSQPLHRMEADVGQRGHKRELVRSEARIHRLAQR